MDDLGKLIIKIAGAMASRNSTDLSVNVKVDDEHYLNITVQLSKITRKIYEETDYDE